MNNPPQLYSPTKFRSMQLNNNRKLWIILGAVIIALIILLVVCAAFVLLGFLAMDNPFTAFAVFGLVSIILLFVGTLLLIILIRIVRTAMLTTVQRKIREAQGWPATKGLVLTSEVRDEGGEDGWRARVIYRYEVEGRVYENSRIAVAVEYGDHSFQANERLAARFPVGARVSVFYDPQNPADSALIKGDPNSSAPSLF